MRRICNILLRVSFPAPRWKSVSPAEDLQRRVGRLVAQGDVTQVTHEVRAGLSNGVFSAKAFASALYLCEGSDRAAAGLDLVRDVRASGLVRAWTDESLLAVILRLQCAVGDAAAAQQMFSYLSAAGLLRLRSASAFLALCCRRGDRATALAAKAEAQRRGLELRAADYLALGRLCVLRREPAAALHAMLREMRPHISAAPPALLAAVLRPWAAAAGLRAELFRLDAGARECAHCGARLGGHQFTAAQRERLMRDVAAAAGMSRAGAGAFATWQRFVEAHGERIDVLIDGANIGYYGLTSWYRDAKRTLLMRRGRRAESIREEELAWNPRRAVDVGVSFELIDAAVAEAQRRGLRPLVLLHARHCEPKNMSAEAERIAARWRRDGALYCTPRGLNDDLCWLHAALKLTTPTDAPIDAQKARMVWVLTNDLMRDHHFRLLSPRYFGQWRDRHRIAFRCLREDGQTRLLWEMPLPYARCIQELEPERWHIPIDDDECTNTDDTEETESSAEEQDGKVASLSEEEGRHDANDSVDGGIGEASLAQNRNWVCLR